MQKFLRDRDIRDLSFSSLFKEKLEPFFSRMKTSVIDPVYDVSSAAEHLSLSQGPVTKGNLWFNTALFSCISPHRMDYLNDDELNFLLHSHSVFLQRVEFQNGTAIFDCYARVEFLGERYGSLDSRSERPSYIIAPCVGVNGKIDPTTCDARPGVVSYYVKQNVFLDGGWRSLIMARVNWFQEHPDRHTHQSGTTEIWCKDIFEPLGPASFIPVQRIQCKFVGTVQKWKRENVLFILPLERNIYL